LAQGVGERCGKFRAAVQRMTNLIDHLLDASHRLDRGTPAALTCADLSLHLLLHNVCERHRDGVPRAWIEAIVDAGVDQVSCGDTKLLFQASSNRVANAIKYALVRMPVIVRACPSGPCEPSLMGKDYQ